MREARFFLTLAVVLLLVFSSLPAFGQGDQEVVARADKYVQSKFNVPNFYAPVNESGRPLQVRELSQEPVSSGSWHIVVWGDWSQVPGNEEIRSGRARFVGFSRYDETVTNPFFPPDATGKGPLDQRNWIAYPWEDKAVSKSYSGYLKSRKFGNSSDPEIIQRLRDGLEWAAKCNGYDPPDPSSDLYQNPQKYVHVYLPPAPNIYGMGVMFHRKPDGSIWYVSVPLGPPLVQKPDLVAVSIDPGVKEADPGGTYSGKVTFKNNSPEKVTGVPVEVRQGGQTVFSATADFEPGEVKMFAFTWTAPGSGTVELRGLINGGANGPHKIEEANYSNNEKRVLVPVRKQVQAGPGSLTFQAVSQDRTIVRDPGTAKWTDWVTATLRPPEPVPPCGWVTWWRITKAELTYPKVNPEFTFGCPYPPEGTVTVPMELRGHEAVVEFQEDWAMDGAQIWCVLEERLMAAEPKEYTLTAQYEIEYEYCWIECDENGCWTECATDTTSGTVSGNLLVNGTGVDSRAE